ncbi:MAG TPA: leucine--tRNA ligase [Deinococcales bacterium]|nr:leucine--tRNA ligase [Deinococcales bacterium]
MSSPESSDRTAPVARFERYNPHEIEPRWRQAWEESGLYRTREEPSKPKHYALMMFPYPSGNLHIGHWYAFSVPDTRARLMRMLGHSVLFPIGFDAFGLPAENAAIKHGIDPAKWTYSNIETMTEQFKRMGTMVDWSTKVATCDPEYYRWNQWFFLQFFKQGLAYKKASFVNWDPVDQTVLANEQVVDGRGERSGALVERRLMEQWHLKITEYAEELLSFEGLEWPERVRLMQTNWIGKSVGAEIDFPTDQGPVTVFTTRPDTVYGATFLVLAPEHPLVPGLTSEGQREAVQAYVEAAARETEIERQAEGREKTGVWTGSYATNPFTDEQVPVWIADYVLVTYGSGAIMAVPAHDQRDFEFARKFGLEVRPVIQPDGETLDGATMAEAYGGPGRMARSGEFDGTQAGKEAIGPIVARMEERGLARPKTTYRLRDWLISRQRYWGTPIPITYCDKCGMQPVPEEQLPVLLPPDVEFLPTGQSPLKLDPQWRFTTCPQCGRPAERDTDTLDTFVDSSWYFYRYLDPQNGESAINPAAVAKWMPVDWYTGGIEHAILHLLYARFWTKAMRDIGLVNFGEPFTRLANQGMILGEDNEKMSKSRGNVVDPDDLVADFGTDTVRLYLQFMGPWEQGAPWAPRGVEGTHRWLHRVWSLFLEAPEAGGESFTEKDLDYAINTTLAKVQEDTLGFRFNTAVAAMMELTNTLVKAKRSSIHGSEAWQRALRTFNLMLAPYAPHMAEELWRRAGNSESVHLQAWPQVDVTATQRDSFELVVQVSGKVRGRTEAPVGISQEDAIALARSLPNVQQWVAGKPVVKEIYVPGKLVNIVVKG